MIAESIKNDWEPLPADSVQGICCVTGDNTQCILRKKGVGAAFTTQGLLKAPESDFISVAAYQAFKYRPERASCWIVSPGKFQKLKRTDIRHLVLNGTGLEIWAGYATTSYKKHGALLATLNIGDTAIWQFEQISVDCSDRIAVNAMYDKLLYYLKSGIGRKTLESCDMPPLLIGKIGLPLWLDFEKWARPVYKSPLYQFLCYLLPSQDELKNEKNENNIQS